LLITQILPVPKQQEQLSSGTVMTIPLIAGSASLSLTRSKSPIFSQKIQAFFPKAAFALLFVSW
jgi:hypothetical protein